MSRPTYFKTCLVSHTVGGAGENQFTFNIQNQIPTTEKYDEIRVNYIMYRGKGNSDTAVNFFCPEIRQFIGSASDDIIGRVIAHNYSLYVSNLQIPASLTFQRQSTTGQPTVFANGDDIVIMLTFIKY